MKKPLRTRAILHLFKIAGIEEGQIPPRWATFLFLAFPPSRIIWRIRSQHYVFMTDTFTIEGIRFNGSIFRWVKEMRKPSPWFRVTGIENGYVSIEQLTPSVPREVLETNDAMVWHIIKAGGTEAQCVIALAKQKQELLEKIFRLEMIAPKKIRMEDGRVMVWRCPDDLVPFTDIGSMKPGGQS